MLVIRLDQPDVTAGVREFTFGTGVGTVVVLALDLVIRLLRGRLRNVLLSLPGLTAALSIIVVAYLMLFTDAAQARSELSAAGALTMLVIGVFTMLWTHLEAPGASEIALGSRRAGR